MIAVHGVKNIKLYGEVCLMHKVILEVRYSILDSYKDVVKIALKAGNLGYIKYIEIERLGNLIMFIWLKEDIEFLLEDNIFEIITEMYFTDRLSNYILTIDENTQLEFAGELTSFE